MARTQDKLIPRKILFGNPERTDVRVSPDGRHVSWLAPAKGVLNVWVAPADDLKAARPVTQDKGRGVRIYFWAYTSRHIVYLQDKDGDENWNVYCSGLDGKRTRPLTSGKGVQARIESVSHKVPEEIVVGLNDRDPKFHDLYRINVLTGERRLMRRNPERIAGDPVVGWMLDDDLNVRFVATFRPDGGTDMHRPAEDGAGWTHFLNIPAEDALTTHVSDFDKTGESLFLADSRGRDTSGLFILDLKTGAQKLLAEDLRCDVGGMLCHPTEKTVLAVSFNYERQRWQVLDASVAPDFEFLRTVADGDFHVASQSLDHGTWVVVYTMDTGPARYYRYDRARRKAKFLFTVQPALEKCATVPMRPVVIESRDGLDLVNYYSLPRGSKPDRAGRPAKPLPTVLLVHGGPWGRDSFGFHPWHQWLADRGYAVLSVNFRGSTGFGKKFVNAGNMEWAGKMHDDLVDAVRWAVREKIADPAKVAIMGGSYGGYATLVGLTFTPETFACGVDIVGPSRITTLLDNMPPYWVPIASLFTSRVGDHRTPEGREFLDSRSPLTFADRIVRPLLIGQGANDPRVKQSESDQIVKAMREKGLPVAYVLYPDEGHGFARPENRLSFFAVAEAFLARHLGGACEPVGRDFENSSIEILDGAEQLPGIEAAGKKPSPGRKANARAKAKR